MDRIELSAGDLRVALRPSVGGSIARFDVVADGQVVPLLRGTDVPYDDVLEAACFPLVPFVNRIRGGEFRCDGRTVRLSPNLPGDASPLHGQGWRSAWTVVDRDAASAVLAFEHAAGEWPWDYEARQRVALAADSLHIVLSCRNRSAEPMPCGLGVHPYWPCAHDTRLDTIVRSAWTIDADVLPVAEVPATERYDLQERAVCGQSLDNGFDGWCGEATVTWPDRGLSMRMSSPDADRFQLYSPASGGVFVAEPVQHANAALNRPQAEWDAAGLRMLAPDATRSLHVRFAPAWTAGGPRGPRPATTPSS